MREQNRTKTSDIKRPGSIYRWNWWNCISADYGRRQFYTADRFYCYDWRSRTYKPILPSSWLAYHYAAISVSGAAFAIGIGQCILMLWSR